MADETPTAVSFDPDAFIKSAQATLAPTDSSGFDPDAFVKSAQSQLDEANYKKNSEILAAHDAGDIELPPDQLKAMEEINYKGTKPGDAIINAAKGMAHAIGFGSHVTPEQLKAFQTGQPAETFKSPGLVGTLKSAAKTAGGALANLALSSVNEEDGDPGNVAGNVTAGSESTPFDLMTVANNLGTGAVNLVDQGLPGSEERRINRIVDAAQFSHNANKKVAQLNELVGGTQEDPLNQSTRFATQSIVPLSIGGKTAPIIAKAADAAVEAAPKVILRTAQGLKYTAPAAAAGAASLLGHEGLAKEIFGIGYGIPMGKKYVIDKALKYFKGTVANTEVAAPKLKGLISQLPDAIATAGDQQPILVKMKEIVDNELGATRHTELVMRTELKDQLQHVDDPDWRGPLKGADADIKKVMERRRVLEAQSKKLEWQAQANKVLTHFGKLGLGAAGEVGVGGATMGAIAASSAQPQDVEQAAEHGATTGMLLAAPFAYGMASGAKNALRVQRARNELIPLGQKAVGPEDPDFEAHQGGMSSLPKEQQDQINVLNGMASKLGGKAVFLTPDAYRAKYNLPPDVPLPPGSVEGNKIFLNENSFQTGAQGHEFGHLTQQAFGDMLRNADPKLMDKFEETYKDAIGKSFENKKFNTQAERDAEVARIVLQETPIEMFSGGEQGGDIVKRVLGNAYRKIFGDRYQIDPTLSAPVSGENKAEMRARLFKAGESQPPVEAPASPATEPQTASATTTPPAPETAPTGVQATPEAPLVDLKQAASFVKTMGATDPEAKVAAAVQDLQAAGEPVTLESVVSRALQRAVPQPISSREGSPKAPSIPELPEAPTPSSVPSVSSGVSSQPQSTSEIPAIKQGETTNASEIPSAASLPVPEIRQSVGRETPLRQQGQIAEIQPPVEQADKEAIPQVNEAPPEQSVIPQITTPSTSDAGVAPLVSKAEKSGSAPSREVVGEKTVDYHAIRKAAEDAKRQELSGTKRKTKDAEIARAGLEAMAQEHARQNGQFMPGKDEKVKWGEADQDDMGEHDIQVESQDGRFSVSPNYYDRENPQDFTVEDHQQRAKKKFDTFAQAKKQADDWLINPPKTPEQIKARDLSNKAMKYRSIAESTARRYGGTVITNPDGTFRVETKEGDFMPATKEAEKTGTDLVTWRTNRYGKTSISGKRIDPSDPFHQHLLDEAKLSPADRQKLFDLQDKMGQTVAIDYLHAPEKEAASGVSRKPEQAESKAQERIAGEKATRRLTKSFVPTWITFNAPSRTFEVNGFSPDKFLNNAATLIPEANRMGLKGYKDVNDPQLVQDFNDMVENHKNGYTMSGKPIEGTPLTPVKPNEDYAPRVIPKDRADLLNAMIGNEGAKVGKREASQEKVDKQILAQRNSPFWEPTTGETNRIRSMLGDNATLLEPTTETLRPELVDKIRDEAVEDAQTLRPSGFEGDRSAFGEAPNQTFAAAGFMPAIKFPALKDEAGRIFESTTHGQALIDAEKQGMKGKPKFGWTTDSGEFLTGEQAANAVRKSGQIPNLKSNDLESGVFKEMRHFMPSTNPRAIKEAAVRGEDGRVFTGQWHADAADAAQEAGVTKYDLGFITNAGEFLDDNAAYWRAKKLRQIDKEYDASMRSSERDKVEPAGVLDSMMFDSMRRDASSFMPSTEGFYSQLERTIQSQPDKASPEQLRAAILKGPGIKQAELRETKDQLGTSFDQWLKDNPKSTKQEMLDFVSENKVQVKEVQKGGAKRIQDTSRGYIVRDRDGNQVGPPYRTRDDATANAEAGTSPTKFSQYQLPGAKEGSYGETLVTLPSKEANTIEIRKVGPKEGFDEEGYAPYDTSDNIFIDDNVFETKQEAQSYASSLKQGWGGKDFASSHWDEPNVVLHLRHNERELPDDKKAFFLEELQSDWAQKGRNEGYASEQRAAWKETKPGVWDSIGFAEGGGGFRITKEKKGFHLVGSDGTANFDHIYNTLKDAQDAGVPPIRTPGVPDMPFKGNAWKQLGMKIALKKAVESGADQLAWTTGEQQAARYDLSKHVDAINVYKRTDATTREVSRSVLIETPQGQISLGVNNDGVIDNSKEYQGKKLDEVIGKEMSKKIMEADLSKPNKFIGPDLKVGGEGMKGFYDKELVNIANDLAKKWGVRVGESKIETGDYGKDPKAILAELNYPDKGGKSTVHSLPITDAMRKDIQEKGQAMFMPSIEAQAKELGLLPIGKVEGLVYFNDPKTKSTIAIKPDAKEGEIKAKLEASRKKFGAQMPAVDAIPQVEPAKSRIPIIVPKDDKKRKIPELALP